jgi:hypothetical protein
MDGPLEIRVERTPNPEALKFSVNRELWSGRPLTVSDPLQAFAMPLAGSLLRLPGVKSLFFLRDFVTVTREPGADWGVLTEAVEDALRQHFAEP